MTTKLKVVERAGGNDEFNRVTLDYAKVITAALTKYSIDSGAVSAADIPEARADDEVSLAVDAVPCIRALVTLAGHILQSLPAEPKVNTTENCLSCIAEAGGDEFLAHMKASVTARRIEAGDDMDARANVAGFTRPLKRSDYN